MKKCVFQSLAIKFLIILIIFFGYICSTRVSAQQNDTEYPTSFSLPFRNCWSYPTKTINYDIASDNANLIIIPTFEGKLLALDSNSGVKIWETELGGKVISNVISDKKQNNIYVATNSFTGLKEDNMNNSPFYLSQRNNLSTVKIRSIDKNTGITNWQTSFPNSESEISTSGVKNEIYIFTYNHNVIAADQSGEIMALSGSDGEIIWSKSLKLKSINNHFEMQDKHLIILSNNYVFLADIETGKLAFQKELDSIMTAAYLHNKTTLIMGNKKGEVFAVDTIGEERIWKFRAGAEISNIISTPKGVLITSFDNFIYLIAPENGKMIWKKRLDGRLVIEPILLGNNVLVMTLGSLKAIILGLDEGKPVNQILLSNNNNYFVSRPVLNNRLIIFPTTDGLIAFTDSDNKCAAG